MAALFQKCLNVFKIDFSKPLKWAKYIEYKNMFSENYSKVVLAKHILKSKTCFVVWNNHL